MLPEETSTSQVTTAKNVVLTSLISSALAGMACDIAFFPLDTLKTRLQSQHGFAKSGGFKRLYQGVGPQLIGSAPAASAFFVTYDCIKAFAQPYIPQQYHFFVHMSAASAGEVVACLIRVPVEVIKQRKQALLYDKTGLSLRTLYRGYGSTVLRDMPFGLTQMPLWEYFKWCWSQHVGRECNPLEGAIFGSMSVAISAILTMPLDVAKTRIMLSNTSAGKDEVKITTMLKEVYRESGAKGLFSGCLPRVGGYTFGGFVFFGIYESVRNIVISFLPNESSAES